MANILIIDDSPTDVRVFTTLLEKAGFSVSSVDNAEAGLDRIRASKPDLVIMDVIMPGMNGFQATRTLSRDPNDGGRARGDDHHQVHGNRSACGACARAPRRSSPSR